MRIDIRGDKIKVTDAIRSHIEEKIGKLDQYFDHAEELKAFVVIRVKNDRQTIEVTMPTPKFTLRCETSHKDLYTAVSQSVNKLERQIRKNKTKLKKKFKEVLQEEFLSKVKEDDTKTEIIKRKTIELRPMDEEEAILQMELLDHDFFVFKNADTDTISVIYKRKDNSYGIIDTSK